MSSMRSRRVLAAVVLLGCFSGFQTLSAQNCFISAPSILASQHPLSIALADFNFDGHLDAVTTNPPDQGVTILLGKGDGTFQPGLKVPVGFQPWYVAIGDFNNDGKPDLAVADYIYCLQSQVYTLLGNGDGTFQPPVSFNVDKTPESLAIADFDGDGIQDIAAANWCSSTVTVSLGNGDGTFGRTQKYSVSSSLSVVAADFNSDGKIDLADIGGDGVVNLLVGNGDGTFQVPTLTAISASVLPNAMTTADFNHDGRADLAIANIYGGTYNKGSVITLLGNGDGTFQPATTYDSGENSEFVTVADLNKDGNLDLAAATENSDGVNVFLGNGDGSFNYVGQFVTGDGSTSVAGGDFDEDGKPDLLVANNGIGTTANGNLSPGNVSFLRGNGNGTFQSGENSVAVYKPEGLATADLNGDSLADLAVVGSSGTLKVLAGQGNGFFSQGFTYQGGVGLDDVLTADFNHDGKLDLVATSAQGKRILVFLANGTGRFQQPAIYAAGKTPRAIASADLNADGNPDIVVSNDIKGAQGTVSVLLGNADGTFQPPAAYDAHGRPKSVAIADFNSDGKFDLAVANFVTGDVSVLLGNGDGSFQPPVNYVAGTAPRWIASGDLNGDGKLDLAVADFGTRKIAVLLGNGDGTFQFPTGYYVGRYPTFVAIQDVNRDGKPDLVAAVSFTAEHGNGTVAVLLGNGDGTFALPTYYGTGLIPRALAFADFNGDGGIDLVSANFSSNNVTVLLDSQTGSLSGN